jgi:hypothetical protein
MGYFLHGGSWIPVKKSHFLAGVWTIFTKVDPIAMFVSQKVSTSAAPFPSDAVGF